MKKKILITGSEGFLGSNFCKHIKNKFILFKYDKKINGDLKNIKKFPKVDFVIHLAAFNSTKDFYRKPLKVIEDNIFPTYNLINFYKKQKKNQYLYLLEPQRLLLELWIFSNILFLLMKTYLQ
jgi:nucleoside-diphosphate-sugar epimerase